MTCVVLLTPPIDAPTALCTHLLNLLMLLLYMSAAPTARTAVHMLVCLRDVSTGSERGASSDSTAAIDVVVGLLGGANSPISSAAYRSSHRQRHQGGRGLPYPTLLRAALSPSAALLYGHALLQGCASCSSRSMLYGHALRLCSGLMLHGYVSACSHMPYSRKMLGKCSSTVLFSWGFP